MCCEFETEKIFLPFYFKKELRKIPPIRSLFFPMNSSIIKVVRYVCWQLTLVFIIHVSSMTRYVSVPKACLCLDTFLQFLKFLIFNWSNLNFFQTSSGLKCFQNNPIQYPHLRLVLKIFLWISLFFPISISIFKL